MKQIFDSTLRIRTVVVGIALLGAAISSASADDWTAQWIGVAGKEAGLVKDRFEWKKGPQHTQRWLAFRKTVALDAAPKKAVAKIAVDSKYWLWLNGELVVFEGQLKRGPNPSDTYYDEVDLTPFLKKGDNTVAILVWYFGRDGFSHWSSGKSGLVFQADINGTAVVSDNTWKGIEHPAFGDTLDGTQPNKRLPESNILFGARKDIAGWQQPGFDDSGWANGLEFGCPPVAPWNQLVKRPIPLWKDSGLLDFANAAELPKVSDGKTIVAKISYNAHITPYLKIKAKTGQKIGIQMDNYKGGSQPNVRAEYITRDGVQEYETLGWMNGHACHFDIPAGVEILALKYRETGYNTEFTGTFECDDPFFNLHRQKALRTLYVTMRDTYYDCPDRERAQWWGDMVNEMGESFYALDARGPLLAKKGILELIGWQREDNSIRSPIPGNFNRELPMQMLNSVGYYGFWTYLLYSGDIETIRNVYPGTKRYMDVWQLGADGLVVQRPGEWTWGDWGEEKDMPILYNGWYYLALKGQLKMAETLGEKQDLPGIKAKMASIEQNFNQTFWNGKEYRSPGYKGKTDDRAHALAVVTGLAKPDQYDAIRQVFRTQQYASPYMEKYVGEALFQMRFDADALARTKERFTPMTDHEFTTLWEGWGIGRTGYGGGTINHAWSGGALTLLSQYAAGVAPEELAFRKYHVLPQMGPLKRIETIVPTPKGNIGLKLARTGKTFNMDLVSPGGTVAVVGIPKSDAPGKTVRVNGVVLLKHGVPAALMEGVGYSGEDRHYLLFTASSGSWAFAAE